ncbi:hypothetical protein ACIHCQ_04760 [Streptomyces sp. NPDC052236]
MTGPAHQPLPVDGFGNALVSFTGGTEDALPGTDGSPLPLWP